MNIEKFERMNINTIIEFRGKRMPAIRAYTFLVNEGRRAA